VRKSTLVLSESGPAAGLVQASMLLSWFRQGAVASVHRRNHNPPRAPSNSANEYSLAERGEFELSGDFIRGQ
jgi:hypothetical protein